MSHKKFGPDRFSRFDVYWIQTNRQTNKHQDKQTNKQTDKPNLYIDTLILVRKVKIEEPRGSKVVPVKAHKLDIFLSVWCR